MIPIASIMCNCVGGRNRRAVVYMHGGRLRCGGRDITPRPDRYPAGLDGVRAAVADLKLIYGSDVWGLWIRSNVVRDLDDSDDNRKKLITPMDKLSKRLKASCIYDAVYGTKEEQGVCKEQMWEAAEYIEMLENENDNLKKNQCDLSKCKHIDDLEKTISEFEKRKKH